MSNHYFHIYGPNKEQVFEFPLRCTTPQTVSIMRQIRSGIPATELVEEGVTFPPVRNADIDPTTMRIEQIEAYFAASEIKQYKMKHAELPKKFKVDPLTIKMAYRESGAKLNNFREAPILIEKVKARADEINDFDTLKQMVVVVTTEINSQES